MKRVESDRAGGYTRFLALAAAILAGLALLGWFPTRRHGGEDALVAMAVGLGAALLASLVGSLPVRAAWGRPLSGAMTAVMGSIALRVVVALAAGLAVALSGWVPTTPLLLWLAIAHAALLVADTDLALRAVRRDGPRRADATP